jgi:hypothetical protein
MAIAADVPSDRVFFATG